MTAVQSHAAREPTIAAAPDELAAGSPLDGVEVGTRATAAAGPSLPFDYEAFRAARHFPALDGLRALSVLLVYFFHAAPGRTGFLSGWEGVTTFFLLSGFLITTLLLREHDATGRVSLRAFYVRRVFRIFPLYFFVLGMHYVLLVQLGIGRHARELSRAMPYFLTYMGEWAHRTNTLPFGQSWTLGIEEKYYLLWPLVLLLLLQRRFRVRIGLVIALVLVPVVTAPVSISHRESLLTGYGRILTGCLIALCLHDRRIFQWLRPLGARRASWALLAVFVGALLLVAPFGAMVYVFPFVAGLFLVSLIVGGSAGASLLSHPVVRYVGTRAYGMYLLDSVVNHIAGDVTPAVTNWPTTLLFFGVRVVAGFVLADVLYRVLEQPLIRLGKRVSRRLILDRSRMPAPREAQVVAP